MRDHAARDAPGRPRQRAQCREEAERQRQAPAFQLAAGGGGPIARDEGDGAQIARNVARHLHPQARTQQAGRLLEQGAGEDGVASLLQQVHRLLDFEAERAGAAQGGVDVLERLVLVGQFACGGVGLGGGLVLDGGLVLGGLRRGGGRDGGLVRRLGFEHVDPHFDGVQLGRQLGDDLLHRQGERIELRAQALHGEVGLIGAR